MTHGIPKLRVVYAAMIGCVELPVATELCWAMGDGRWAMHENGRLQVLSLSGHVTER